MSIKFCILVYLSVILHSLFIKDPTKTMPLQQKFASLPVAGLRSSTMPHGEQFANEAGMLTMLRLSAGNLETPLCMKGKKRKVYQFGSVEQNVKGQSFLLVNVSWRSSGVTTRAAMRWMCLWSAMVSHAHTLWSHGVMSLLPHTDTMETLPIRLVSGPTSSSGRVQVLHDGSWGGICGENFRKEDAKVACRQLQYSGVKQVSHFNDREKGSYSY